MHQVKLGNIFCPDRTLWAVATMACMQAYMLFVIAERWWRDGVRDGEEEEVWVFGPWMSE